MRTLMKTERPVHGGDWAGYEIEYGREALDFSMNVNPLGIPAAVTDAIAKAGRSADRYPDPECRRLTRALADCEDVPPEWIRCGNGAADLIDRIALAFRSEHGRKALVTAPAFAEYEAALERCGWETEHVLLREEDGFALPEDTAERITEQTGILFLCEPNNPTGVTTGQEGLRRILERCRQTGTILVIDECFNGFLEDPAACTMKSFLGQARELILLKAFTKTFGMAGVRLGYCLCSDPDKLEAVRRAGQPWSVSLLAEEAGLAALGQKEHVEEARRIVTRERARLKEELGRLGICRVFGEANYLLFRYGPDGQGEDRLDRKLRRRGILIRSCDNYRGLGPGWYRAAVRTHEENTRLLEALEAIAGEE